MKNRRRPDSNRRITVLQTIASNSQEQQKQQLTTQAEQRLQTRLQTESKNGLKQASKQTQELPTNLAEIVQAWPKLPEHIRAAVKALVHSSTGIKPSE